DDLARLARAARRPDRDLLAARPAAVERDVAAQADALTLAELAPVGLEGYPVVAARGGQDGGGRRRCRAERRGGRRDGGRGDDPREPEDERGTCGPPHAAEPCCAVGSHQYSGYQ